MDTRHAATCVQIQIMDERLISVDVERLGNVQWWSLESQCTSDQMVRTKHCEEETRGCCAVSMWDITRDGAAIVLTPDGVKRGDGTREMGPCVQSNACWSSLASETGSTESGETLYLNPRQNKVLRL